MRQERLDTSAHLFGFIEDEANARRSHARKDGALSAMYGTLSAMSGGLAAFAWSVGVGMGLAAAPLATIFGVVSALGCVSRAFDRDVDATSYGVDD